MILKSRMSKELLKIDIYSVDTMTGRYHTKQDPTGPAMVRFLPLHD